MIMRINFLRKFPILFQLNHALTMYFIVAALEGLHTVGQGGRPDKDLAQGHFAFF